MKERTPAREHPGTANAARIREPALANIPARQTRTRAGVREHPGAAGAARIRELALAPARGHARRWLG